LAPVDEGRHGHYRFEWSITEDAQAYLADRPEHSYLQQPEHASSV